MRKLVTVKQVGFTQFRFSFQTERWMAFLEKLTLRWSCSFTHQKEPSIISSLYSWVFNKRPGMLINFGGKFHPRHVYSKHPVYLSLNHFSPTPFFTNAFLRNNHEEINKFLIKSYLLTTIQTSNLSSNLLVLIYFYTPALLKPS